MVKNYVKNKTVQLSKNFKSSEFNCKCGRKDCINTLIDTDLVACTQKARDLVKKPIVVNSAYRCATHNKNVGGVSTSKHTKGLAVDLKCPSGITLKEFAWVCEQAGFRGVLRYDGQNFVHCDMRDNIYRGITTNGGKSYTQVDTFNPTPPPTVTTVVLPVLRKGSKNNTVGVLQNLLNNMGYKGANNKALTVDCIYGTNCIHAVTCVQKAFGLPTTGEVDQATWNKLLGV